MLKYDDVLNRQRKVIYGERRQVLEGADLHEQVREMVDEVVAGYVAGATAEGYPEDWDLNKLWHAFRQLFPISVTVDDVIEEAGGDQAGLSGELITEVVVADAQAAYDRREQELSPEIMRELERRVVLSVLDRKWREHLYEMDYLREGIGLRGYGQRDPLVEYQREGYDMFNAMMDGHQGRVRRQPCSTCRSRSRRTRSSRRPRDGAGGGRVLRCRDPGGPAQGAPARQRRGAARGGRAGRMPARQPGQAGAQARSGPAARPDRRTRPGRGVRAAGGPARRGAHAEPGDGQPAARRRRPGRAGATPAAAAAVLGTVLDGGRAGGDHRGPADGDAFARAGRNDPCPCGSGRKFKRCHGDPRMRADL